MITLLEELFPGELVKSHQIAASVNTSPIVVRRILGKLRQVGLVEVHGGATGGARLARRADQISLLHVFQAIEDEEFFAMHPNEPSRTCPVGATIAPVLQEVYENVDSAITAVLKDRTIGEIYREITNTYCEVRGITPEQMRRMGQERLG